MGYSFDQIKKIVIKPCGKPYSLNSNVYTEDIRNWIMSNIIGDSTLNGKLWCIAHDLVEVPTCANPECSSYTQYHNKFKNGFRKFCGNMKCSNNHSDTKKAYRSTSLKNWGTENPLKNKEVRERYKDIIEERYGHRYAMQSQEIKEKYKSTSIKKYGTENPLMNEDVKRKGYKTLIDKYGVKYPAQNLEIMEKIMNSRVIRTNTFNDKLYYQSKYELHFLNSLEGLGLISFIENGLTFNYTFLNNTHLYVSDFFIPKRNEIIEIKSNWTFNRNGSDLVLENKNLAKKNIVLKNGYNFKFLIGYSQIDEYIEGLRLS